MAVGKFEMALSNDKIRLNRNVYFFGCGSVAKRISSNYKDIFRISGFITDYEKDWGKIIDGIKIYPPTEILKDKNNFIVIATNKATEEISARFENLGLIPEEDFSHYTVWLRKYFQIVLENTGKLLQDFGECYITDKCSLKCKHCAVFAPYFMKAHDRDFEEVKRDIDLYFKFVDKVSVFRLLGGETFLYKKLDDLLEYMGGGIIDKIGKMFLVSNGTIIPPKSTLNLLAKYNIAVSVSDYPLDICQNQRPKIIETFEKFGVEYVIDKISDGWYDVWGDPKIEKYGSVHQMKKIFTGCHVWCRVVYKEKFYFCLNDLAAKRMGYVGEDAQDYVNLESEDETQVKRDMLALDSKKTEKGYLNACKNCFSLSPQNQRVIPVAEQVLPGENFFSLKG